MSNIPEPSFLEIETRYRCIRNHKSLRVNKWEYKKIYQQFTDFEKAYEFIKREFLFDILIVWYTKNSYQYF